MYEDLCCCLLPEYADVPKTTFDEVVNEGAKTMVLSHVSEAPAEGEKEAPAANRFMSVVGVLLIAITIVATAAIIYFSGMFGSMFGPEMVNIIDVTNMNVEQAQNELVAAGFDVVISQQYERIQIRFLKIMSFYPHQSKRKYRGGKGFYRYADDFQGRAVYG